MLTLPMCSACFLWNMSVNMKFKCRGLAMRVRTTIFGQKNHVTEISSWARFWGDVGGGVGDLPHLDQQWGVTRV